MPNIFITAFEPYDDWEENSSWLALVEFTKTMPPDARITTRRYPVDFQIVRKRLESDLEEDFDYALHLGQAPGSANIHLESIGVNIGGSSEELPESFQPLVADGPIAYRSELPLGDWASQLRQAGIPTTISYHAGTFLCNATLYLSHHIARQRRLRTKATFIHLPLDASQSAKISKETAALPASLAAAGLRLIVDDLIKRGQPGAPVLF